MNNYFLSFATTSLLLEKGCRLSIVLYVVVLLFLSGRVSAQAPLLSALVNAPPVVMSKLVLTDHPLVGKIWDAREKKWVNEAALQQAILSHTFILLGETHDNHVHHQRHLQVLKWLTVAKQKPALVMEQFDIEHQAAIDDAIAAGKNAESIADAGRLNRRGWQWPQYQPLVATALANNTPLVAANLSRQDARNVFAKGFSAIPAYALPVDFAPRLFDATWNAARHASVVATMVDSHCGQLPAERAPGMVNAQRARDAVMSHAMLTHQKIGAVLVAGRGHVRQDTGVPLYIKQLERLAKVISIGFVEVAPDKNTPDAYSELRSTETSVAPFDYVWFSARQERKDPCEGMTLGNIVAPVAATPATTK